MENLSLKEIRVQYNISQKEASKCAGVPLRTYIRYENNVYKTTSFKYRHIIQSLIDKYQVTEEKGILSLDFLKTKLSEFLKAKGIEYCYLFGSYAKGYATDGSDVDICISSNITGLEFFGLVEELRQTLCKKVDLLRLVDVIQNIDLLNEIMKDGIRIDGQR